MIKGATGFVLGLMAVVGTSAGAESITWPQQLTGDNGAVVLIYQPQIESFSGNNIEARAAYVMSILVTFDLPMRAGNSCRNSVHS